MIKNLLFFLKHKLVYLCAEFQLYQKPSTVLLPKYITFIANIGMGYIFNLDENWAKTSHLLLKKFESSNCVDSHIVQWGHSRQCGSTSGATLSSQVPQPTLSQLENLTTPSLIPSNTLQYPAIPYNALQYMKYHRICEQSICISVFSRVCCKLKYGSRWKIFCSVSHFQKLLGPGPTDLATSARVMLWEDGACHATF